MKKYLRLIKYLFQENYKTIYFNFKYFPFSEAICFPVIVSKNVYLKRMKGTITFDCPIRYKIVSFGFGNVGIFDDKMSRSIWEVSGDVIFKGKTQLGHGSKISVGNNGVLVVGDNFKINAESTIVAHRKVEFGNDCLLSWDVLIMDSDFHSLQDQEGNKINESKPISIGDHVWIGCRTTILKGTEIPSNCVIGANTVLSRKLEKQCAVYAGSPAKIVKENIVWS